MNFEQLAFWLRGSVEARNFDNISMEDAKALLKSIQDHSALPFNKVTPERNKVDQALNDLIKRAAQKPIVPNGVQITPPAFPSPRHDYDRKDYWLHPLDRGFKPGEVTC